MLNKIVSVETPGVVKLEPPAWLDREARAVWDKKLRELERSNLLDDIDVKALATFCNAVVQYAEISKKQSLGFKDHRALQHYSWIILWCSDQLGFNPLARRTGPPGNARLLRR